MAFLVQACAGGLPGADLGFAGIGVPAVQFFMPDSGPLRGQAQIPEGGMRLVIRSGDGGGQQPACRRGALAVSSGDQEGLDNIQGHGEEPGRRPQLQPLQLDPARCQVYLGGQGRLAARRYQRAGQIIGAFLSARLLGRRRFLAFGHIRLRGFKLDHPRGLPYKAHPVRQHHHFAGRQPGSPEHLLPSFLGIDRPGAEPARLQVLRELVEDILHAALADVYLVDDKFIADRLR